MCVVSRGRRIAIAIAALARGSKAIVELLVAFGADLNGVNPAKRFTALHAVAQSGKEDVATAEDHADIVEDTKEECGKYGQVASVEIPRDGAPGTGLVFVAFAEAAQAAAASNALAGRTFDGKTVEAAPYDEERFAAGDFSG